MKYVIAGLGLALLATPACAIDAWPQCNSPERNAKALWACNQVIAYGNMSDTIAALTYESLALADQLVAGNPAYENFVQRAWVHREVGKDAEGLADADKAVEISNEMHGAFSIRAKIKEALGRKDEAVADYRADLKQLTSLKQPDQFETTEIWADVQALQRLGEKP